MSVCLFSTFTTKGVLDQTTQTQKHLQNDWYVNVTQWELNLLIVNKVRLSRNQSFKL